MAQPVPVWIQSREYFVGWFTLSLINAGLAQSKGRSGLLWWVAPSSSARSPPFLSSCSTAWMGGSLGGDRTAVDGCPGAMYHPYKE